MVFIVVHREYDDSDIQRVFSSLEAAKEFVGKDATMEIVAAPVDDETGDTETFYLNRNGWI